MTVARGTFLIVNERGLHARAASAFVNVAARFESRITVSKDGQTVDGESILGIVSLLGLRGTEIEVAADGADAEAAVATLGELVAKGFDEGALR